MNIRCEQLDELLLDGEPLAMATAARHAQTCEACRQTLAEWNEISSTAKSLKTSWQSDLLLPRIQKAIREDRKKTSWSWSRISSIAAAAVLTIGIGASSWWAMRLTTRDTRFTQAIMNVSAIDEVERAEQAHIAAINKLAEVAEPKLDAASTPLMISYKEKLMLLDDAIAECEAQIQQNRQNANLRQQLLAIYSEKQNTLSAVLREGSDNASNQ